MNTSIEHEQTRLAPLMTPAGGFAMVAIDQRESMRDMFAARIGSHAPVPDSTLVNFKRSATATLSPLASAVLLDRGLGIEGERRPDDLDGNSGLILAADAFAHIPGIGVAWSSFDRGTTAELVTGVGAVAVKLLVLWRRGEQGKRVREYEPFLELAKRAGVPTLIEGVVRPVEGHEWSDPNERFDAIVEAAAELGPLTDLYKAEVPGYLPGDLSRVAEYSRQISRVVPGPWVVLSNGVQQIDFASALHEALANGASGFLAGRAVWADAIVAADPTAHLRDVCLPRLAALRAIVDEAVGK